jgi:hypothetical protein
MTLTVSSFQPTDFERNFIANIFSIFRCVHRFRDEVGSQPEPTLENVYSAARYRLQRRVPDGKWDGCNCGRAAAV